MDFVCSYEIQVQFPLSISEEEISVMLKLSPEVSILLEQIHNFKINVRAKLTIEIAIVQVEILNRHLSSI